MSVTCNLCFSVLESAQTLFPIRPNSSPILFQASHPSHQKSRSRSDKCFSIRLKETMILSRLQKCRLGSLHVRFFALATTKIPRTCFSLPHITPIACHVQIPAHQKNRRKSKKRGPNRDRTGDFRISRAAIPHWLLLVWLWRWEVDGTNLYRWVTGPWCCLMEAWRFNQYVMLGM